MCPEKTMKITARDEWRGKERASRKARKRPKIVLLCYRASSSTADDSDADDGFVLRRCSLSISLFLVEIETRK